MSMACSRIFLAPACQLAVVERLCDNNPDAQAGMTDT